eukprot:scaffold1691_cov107-Isochrysis_galbana.AAC.9
MQGHRPARGAAAQTVGAPLLVHQIMHDPVERLARDAADERVERVAQVAEVGMPVDKVPVVRVAISIEIIFSRDVDPRLGVKDDGEDVEEQDEQDGDVAQLRDRDPDG